MNLSWKLKQCVSMREEHKTRTIPQAFLFERVGLTVWTAEGACPLHIVDRDIILGVPGGRTNEQWIAQYGSSHQHPVNRVCHTLGIPTILLSIPVFIASIWIHRLWLYALALFLIGWIFQFVGHAFEGKPPEFFHDWRFLFVGVRWWWAKIHGKA
jgi:hypothetical protein